MVAIYGAGDDLIEVEGDIKEEFSPDEEGEPSYLVFSDGTVLSVFYDSGGIWRVNRKVEGAAGYTKAECDGGDENDDYSERVALDGDIRWCVFGSELVKRGKG